MAAVIDLASTPNSTALKLPSSSHRLPSVSAAEAFQALSDAKNGPSVISTGINGLDDALGGGIEVGKVTELWGPIGAGKTAIAYIYAAISKPIAILVTTGCATRQRPGMPLGLVPGVGGGEWEAGVWGRVVVCRDFGVRVAGVQKARGSAVAAGARGLENVSDFTVDGHGKAVPVNSQPDADAEGAAKAANPSPARVLPVALPRKRAFDEIADSDDEEGVDEYGGWADVEEDVALVADAVDSTAAAAIDLT
ncbi:hypothetical protein B0A48_12072 [Cryoendolithus antarcticus]|uniref:KaiC-like domain-containing protein n=1 Tax=Cryoendolithus antarcticus TaxID=1507870 RepID=A0A1V8STM8_9PEZI|nr:hypothetical protein B0A48_12072 [Cryoendolithus antarcticus]